MAQKTAADDSEQSTTNDSGSVTVSAPLRAEVSVFEQMLGTVTDEDVSELSDDEITALWSDLKEVSDLIEHFRKEQIEDEMRERVEIGDRLAGVSRIGSHNKFVMEDAATVIGRAANRGIDYTEFIDLNASTLADDHPDLAEIGKAEYDYFR